MWRLIITAFVFAVLALVAGVLLGWRVTQPAEALTDAAVRLGQGDFATSIPTAGPAEIGQLARTMDDMRRNLVELNSELRHREAEAQVVLEAVVEGVYAVDQERNIRYLNPQAARLLGIEAARGHRQVLRRRAQALRAPGIAQRHAPLRHHRVSHPARAPGGQRAVRGAVADAAPGTRQTVITSSRVVNGLQVQVLRDETELEGVRRARDTVLANVSHEFRTPLAAQLASIELLREGLKTAPPGEARGAGAVARARHAAAHAAHRQPAGERAHRVRTARRAPPEHRARRCRRRRAAAGRGAAAPAPPAARSGRARRARAAGRRHAPHAGVRQSHRQRQQVRARGHADPHRCSRRRARRSAPGSKTPGPGLPEGDAVGIFERFKRGGTQEPEPGGLGLGLWISRSIVERHGGSITAGRTADRPHPLHAHAADEAGKERAG